MADPLLVKRPEGALPGSLQGNPNLGQWVRFAADGTVQVTAGKVEIGQGILTALSQIAAEELDVSPARIRMIGADTTLSPNEGVTSGSLSIQDSGTALRYACAEIRAILLAEAAEEFGVPIDQVSVRDGTITIRGRASTTSYWALAHPGLLDRRATASVAPTDPSAYAIVGHDAPRLDLPDKIMGRPRYVHDLALPEMLFGRVVRPSSPWAELVSLDESAARALGATVVRDGSFVGVLAVREDIAVRAAERLAAGARWRSTRILPDDIGAFLRSAPAEHQVLIDTTRDAGPAGARVFRASYAKPFIAHASIGPSCAIAQWSGGADDARLTVHSHTQGIFNLRADLGKAFRMPEDRIVVRHVEGAGCYGHNPADDVAMDAALLARAAGGRPVQVAWTRQQELAWGPFGSAMEVDLVASVGEDGSIIEWRHELFSHGHSSRPGRDPRPTLLSSYYMADGFELPVAIDMPLPNGGSERNAVPGYAFDRQHISKHRVTDMPIRVSALRSLGAYANVFAIESFMDELAHAHGVDPVEYRLRHLVDPRGRAVVETAARRAGWTQFATTEARGHGIAWARYKNVGAWAAVVAEVELGHEVRVTRLVCAVDVGMVVNPDGVINQVEGGAIQATSWALKEAVRFDRERIAIDGWEEYPILKFSEVPEIVVELIDRKDQPSLGAGEAVQGPIGAAIANAIFDALGVRVRTLPLTSEAITAASG